MNRKLSYLVYVVITLFYGCASHHRPETDIPMQSDRQSVLTVSECLMHGDYEDGFFNVQLINTGTRTMTVVVDCKNELWMDPMNLRVYQLRNNKYSLINDYWIHPYLGGGAVDLRRLYPGETIVGRFDIGLGEQFKLKNGRYLGVLDYSPWGCEEMFGIKELDKMRLITCVLFDIPAD